MSFCFQEASQAIDTLLQVADRAGLLKPEERELILSPHAFLGVSYGTIYMRLNEAMVVALASRYEGSLPALEAEWPNVEPHLRYMVRVLAEHRPRLTATQGLQLMGMLEDGHWQHVYRYMLTGLVQVILTEDADGSV